MGEIVVAKMNDQLSRNFLHSGIVDGYGDYGWNFGNGDPELYRFIDKFYVSGGWVLDLGCGFGRNAIPLAMYGMNILGVDNIRSRVVTFNENALNLRPVYRQDIKILAVEGDVYKMNYQEDQYNLAIMSNLFIHAGDFGEVASLLMNTYKTLVSGGYLWIRVLGSEDSTYEELTSQASLNPDLKAGESGNVFLRECGCSGRMIMEPVMFFNTGDLLFYLCKMGYKIEYQQTIPVDGSHNILFGNDYALSHEEFSSRKFGMISILARK